MQRYKKINKRQVWIKRFICSLPVGVSVSPLWFFCLLFSGFWSQMDQVPPLCCCCRLNGLCGCVNAPEYTQATSCLAFQNKTEILRRIASEPVRLISPKGNCYATVLGFTYTNIMSIKSNDPYSKYDKYFYKHTKLLPVVPWINLHSNIQIM